MTKSTLSQAMLEAAASGDVEGWVSAMGQGAHLLETNLGGQNALMCALSGGHDDLALLIAGRMLGEDPGLTWMKQAIKGSGQNVFHVAVLHRRHRLLAALMAFPERTRLYDMLWGVCQESPFHLAARENATKALALLAKGCPQGLEARADPTQSTPLGAAIGSDKEEAVEWLLEKGCLLASGPEDVFPAWSKVQTAGMLGLLAKHHAWDAVRTPQGGTLLHALLHRGKDLRLTLLKAAFRQEGVKALLDAQDDRGRTPLQVALSANAPTAAIDFLIEQQANWWVSNHDGETSEQLLLQQVENGWALPEETVRRWQACARGQRLDHVFSKDLASGVHQRL